MAYQRQGLDGPSEAAAQQSTCPQVYHKNNQHAAQCVFKERPLESSSKIHLRTILLEWYVYLNERHCLPGTWDCPLPSCNQQCSTLPDVISHLEGCRHFKSSTRQYTCPACKKDVRMTARGHGEKAMLKLKRSLDNLLGSPNSPSSSTGSSPFSPLSFDAGSPQERNQVPPVSYLCGNSEINSQAINPSSQHNRSFAIEPFLVTQFNPSSKHANGSYTSNSCPTSTTTDSSYDSGTWSALSCQGISSAVSSSSHLTCSSSSEAWIQGPIVDGANVFPGPNMAQLPCYPHHVGELPCELDLSVDTLLQETADIGSTGSFFPMESDTKIKYDDVQEECQGEITCFLQDNWSQRGVFSSFMAELAINSLGEHGSALEAGSTYPAHDSFSPVSSDVAVDDSPPKSVDSPPAAGSLIPKCEICQWEPDKSVKRSLKKLAAAVEKHITRNHRSRDFECPICYQVFKNRPDNVKPHVTRKHPEMLASLYPTKAVMDGPPHDEKPSTLARTTPKRKASQSASPGGRKHLRFQRG